MIFDKFEVVNVDGHDRLNFYDGTHLKASFNLVTKLEELKEYEFSEPDVAKIVKYANRIFKIIGDA